MNKRSNVLIIDASQFTRFRCVSRLKVQHNVQIVATHDGLRNIIAEHKNGLDFYDLIIMEPHFYHGKYGHEATSSSLQTGWFIYEDLMKHLSRAKLIILSFPIEQYMYGENNYPERKWGENVVALRSKYEGNDDQFLINLVDEFIVV